MANLQYVLHKGNKNTGSLKFVQPEAMQAVLEFHSGIAGYAQTPLVSLPNLAKQLGVGQIFVKDESARFGMNAFKALGGSYAIARYLCGKLNIPVDGNSFNVLCSEEARAKLGTVTNAATGSGVGPLCINHVVGVVKAYTTRVGEGPFVCELFDADGNALRERGHEYGTVTGRPRRCGWLDAFMLKYSARVNSLDCLAVTRLDILDEMPVIKMCVGYKYNGEEIKQIPASLKVLAQVEPVYEEFEGWMTDISGVRKYEDLPENCKKYLKRMSEVAGVEVGIVSVGPDREQTMILKELF